MKLKTLPALCGFIFVLMMTGCTIVLPSAPAAQSTQPSISQNITAGSAQNTTSGSTLENSSNVTSFPPEVASTVTGIIGEAEAKTIVLAKVPGATEQHLRLHLDYDDGRAVYEGSVVYEEMKYEFELNAADGIIVEWSIESIFDD